MKIVWIVAGAGGMYCGACIHSSTLVAALRRAGEDALLVPAYTPVRMEEEEQSIASRRVVFGGLNGYLQQKSALARRAPRFLDRLLDHPAILRWLGRASGSTRPERLGPLCVSMLQGEQGRQRKEIHKLIDWLRHDLRPDVVHLSTALLAGMAGPISRAIGVPVVATLAGEDGFVDRLGAPYASQARLAMSRGCREMAALVSLHRGYADFMASYLDVPRQRIHVIAPGIDLAGHRATLPRPAPTEVRRSATPTVGFLSRVCHEKGLHVVADAFVLLSQNLAHREAGPSALPWLKAAGYLSKTDVPYLAEIKSRLAASGMESRFEFVGCVTRDAKIAFLQSLDMMCLPTLLPESKGLPVLEAWANGVPVIVSDHGALGELVRETGGGTLVPPNEARSLADAIRQLIDDPVRAAALGRRGQEAVSSRYSAERMARDTIALYRSIVGAAESV